MTTLLDNSETQQTNRCNECGRDTNTTAYSDYPRTHPSRLVPFVLTTITVLTLLILSLPFVQTAMGNPWNISKSTSKGLNYTISMLDPVLSIEDTRRAIAGESLSKSAILLALKTKLDELDEYLHDGRLRFVSVKPSGQIQEAIDFGIGERIFGKTTVSHLTDVRDPASWMLENPTSFMMPDSVNYWPYDYHTVTNSHNYARQEYTSLRYTAIIALISTSWLIVWGVGLALAKFRNCSLRRWTAIAPATIALLGSIMLLSAITVERERFVITTTKPTATSEWIMYQKLNTLLDEPAPLWEILDEHIVPETTDNNLLLGIQVDPGYDTTQTDWWMGWGGWFEFCSGKISSISRVDPQGNTSPLPTPAWIERGWSVEFVENRYLVFTQTSDTQINTFEIAPTAVFLLTAVSIWYWMFWRWIARRITRTVQRRRLVRDQCVFCAYPLSEDAIEARAQAKIP